MSWRRWQEAGAAGVIGNQGLPGQGTRCCSATLFSQLPPASVQRAPASLRQEPVLLGRRCPAAQPQPPACSVCFLSRFAKCLLIFSTKSRCLPRGARVSTHYIGKRVQPPSLTNNPTTNRKGHMNQHQQQVATLLRVPVRADRGTEATLHLPEESPDVYPSHQLCGRTAWGTGERRSDAEPWRKDIHFVPGRRAVRLIPSEAMCKRKEQDNKEWS